MFDDFKVANYSKALVSPELYARHLSRLFAGDVVDGLTVVPGTGLQVVLQPGNTFIRYGSSAVASARLVSLVNTFTLTIATPDVSNPRHDLVVVYVDTSVSLPSGTPSSANLDGKGVAKAVVVKGTAGSSPTDPNGTAIQAAIGSSAYSYTIVARVRVNAGVSVIASNLITDLRTGAKVQKQNIDFDSGVWWEELGRHTLGSPATSMSVPSFAAKKFLRIIVAGSTTGGTFSLGLRFNNDSAANYTNHVIYNSSAPNFQAIYTAIGGANQIQASTTVMSGASVCVDVPVMNFANSNKIMQFWSAGEVGGLTAGYAVNFEGYAGKWVNNTSQITRVDVIRNPGGTGSLAAGSELIILGHN